MRFSKNSWEVLLVASIVLVAGLCAQSQQAAHAEEETQPEGKIVRIAPDPEEEVSPDGTPVYWIGISGRGVESAVLRTHLQLAQDMGIVVEQVVADSPADKAGLRKHDIILRVNGTGVHSMRVLQDHVRTHRAEPLELKLIRLGKEETIVVVPEQRPQKLAERAVDRGRNGWGHLEGSPDGLRDLLKQLQRGGEFRLGPEAFFPGEQWGFGRLPSGVSVSIQRENDGPVKITVKQGDRTWHLDSDDPESLDQLPENLRPFAERLLQGNEGARGDLGFDWQAELEGVLPRGLGGPQRGVGLQENEITRRLERLEQELRELQKRLAEE